MFSFIKQKSSSPTIHKSLLDESELLDLRQAAEQINCSTVPLFALESRHSGNLLSRALGSGIDYAESRVYQPGDDTRSINWRLSARSQETFVKTFYVESRPSMSVFLDRRRPMIFGTRGRLKITQAVRVAHLLAYAADYHQLDFRAWVLDDIGITHFDNTEVFLAQANKPCSKNTVKLNPSFSLVLQDIFDLLANGSLQAQGSLVYLLSDFSDLEEKHQAELARLHEQCFVQAIHIRDKAEFELPKMGKLRLQDMHEDRNYQLDTHKQKDRENFSQLSKQFFMKRKSIIKDIGITYNSLEADLDNLQNDVHIPLGRS